MTTVDAIVIGAGHNGLVAACYLARAGRKVLVVEQADHIGGMTATHSGLVPGAPDHRFNRGALGALMIQASTVIRDLNLERFGYQQVICDPGYAACDPKGDSLALWRDHRRTADELRRFSHQDAAAFLDLVRTTDAATDVVVPVMNTDLRRPAPRDLWAMARKVKHPARLARMAHLSTASLAEVVDERFKHPLLKGLLAGLASAAGPITTKGSAVNLAVASTIARLGEGRVIGGTGAFTAALERCLAAAGGEIRLSAPVDQLLVTAGAVRGVHLTGGEEITAGCVIAACDPRTTLSRLLPPGTLSDRLTRRAAAIPTGNDKIGWIKVDVALSGRLELPHHQARRSDGVDLRRVGLVVGALEDWVAATHAAQTDRLHERVPFIGCVPTAIDSSQAPDRQDTLYLWADCVPHDMVGESDVDTDLIGKAVIDHASDYYEGIERLEIGRFIESPSVTAARTGATDGNWCHVDFRPKRLGPLRPALGFGGYQTPVSNLFLSGAGTHPGPGLCGIPGQLAARRALRSTGR
jgi:phytoene dehydrogenase-like protein